MEFYLNIAQKIPVMVLLLLISATSVVSGDYFAKSWSLNQKGYLLAATMICYFMSAVFYVPTLLREGLVITTLIWYLLSFVGFLIVGLVIFKESLNPTQMVGVVLGLISLTILVKTVH